MPRNSTKVVGKSRGRKSLRGRFSIQYIKPATASPKTSAVVENRASVEIIILSPIEHGLTGGKPSPMRSPTYGPLARYLWIKSMKVRNSLKSLAKRHRDNKLVRRKGRIYIINKTNPRFKARQG